MLKSTDALLKVTIVPRTNQVLGFASYMPQDQKLFNKDEVSYIFSIYFLYIYYILRTMGTTNDMLPVRGIIYKCCGLH